jgi:copper chaperone CopZ
MNILYLFLSILFISIKGYAHDNSEKNHEVTDSAEILSSGVKSDNLVNVATVGMVCDFCAQAIEKVFMKRQEVQGIKIDLNNQKVILFLKKDVILDDALILKLFEDAGYGVEKIDKSI